MTNPYNTDYQDLLLAAWAAFTDEFFKKVLNDEKTKELFKTAKLEIPSDRDDFNEKSRNEWEEDFCKQVYELLKAFIDK